ncbi:MAG: hypothetical protein ACREV7_13630 [Steroidobacteraceae bacterium]
MADPLRPLRTANGLIEHATYGQAIDVFTTDAESDEAACKHIDDHKDPMAAKNLHAESMRELLGDALIAEPGVARVEFDDSSLTRSSVGPFGPGLREVPVDENRRRYFLCTSVLWNRNNVAGLRMAASFPTRR